MFLYLFIMRERREDSSQTKIELYCSLLLFLYILNELWTNKKYVLIWNFSFWGKIQPNICSNLVFKFVVLSLSPRAFEYGEETFHLNISVLFSILFNWNSTQRLFFVNCINSGVIFRDFWGKFKLKEFWSVFNDGD